MMHKFFPQHWHAAMARFEHRAVAENCKHRIGLLGRARRIHWLVKATSETHRVTMGCQMMPGMSPVQCMKVAEHLYTSGYISYTAQTETAQLNPAESSGFLGEVIVNCNCFGKASF